MFPIGLIMNYEMKFLEIFQKLTPLFGWKHLARAFYSYRHPSGTTQMQ